MRLKLALLLLATLPATADTRLALRDGEVFTYKVSWAVLPGAGEIKISAHADTAGARPQLRVSTTTATRGLARMLLPFDAKGESFFDLRSGRIHSLTESSRHRGKRTEHTVTFDYAAAQALYSLPGDTANPRLLPMPAGDPMDLITQLVQTRSWELKPGEKRDALVLFDDDFYELTIHAARHEEVWTSLGTFKTLVLEPRMEKTAPKGMFKRGSSVRVWISQDELRLPVKFEVEFKIGTGVATLTRYEAPEPAKAPAAADARPAKADGVPASRAKNTGP
ncbi:MAG: DUF3108 domain-containing protein [Verrucomicrobia bacterium]|nr:DUF3108 domain-containing protein [Verrucomicrobiota bacterium]